MKYIPKQPHNTWQLCFLALLTLLALPVPAQAAGEPATDYLVQAFQDHGWGGVIALCLLSFLLLFGVVSYARLPLLGARLRNDEEFWRQMPQEKGRFLGVLYSDETIRASVGRGGWFSVRRLMVLLKHRDGSRDRVVFRNEENPNRFCIDDTVRAFTCWIETAREHNVPAVYRTRRDHQILSSGQIDEIEADTVAFAKRFRKHLRKGKPLPPASTTA